MRQPDCIIHLSDNLTLHRVNCDTISIPGVITVIIILMRGNLSTASIHLLSVYQPENRAPTSLSLKKMGESDKQQLERWIILTPEVFDDGVNGGKSLARRGGQREI